jgi:hypothetical protein
MALPTTTPVATRRMVLALMLILMGNGIASTTGATAECAFGVPSYNARSSCVRDLLPPTSHVHHPNSDVRSSNDTRLNGNRWEAARVLGAASVVGQGATERGSPVARSISEVPWVDSNDWIHNPPEWLREIKESRRRRAPVPLVHLWRSQRTQTLVALGVSHRGQPGLFIARKLPY